MALNNITAGDGIVIRQTGVASAQVAIDPAIQSAIAALQVEVGKEGTDFQSQIDSLVAAIARIRTSITNIASTPATGDTIPAGLIAMWHGLLADIPTGWVLCDGTNGTPDLREAFIKGSAAGIDPGVTGGSNTHTHDDHNYTPTGTVSQPTFTGTPDNTSADSAGTPTGTVSAPTFTGTPDVTSSDSAGTPTGTVSAPIFSGTLSDTSAESAGTPAGTNSGGAVSAHTGTAVAAHAAHTHDVVSNVSVNDHASHTHSVTSNVSVNAHANHTHTFTQSSNSTTPDLVTANTAAAGVAASGTTGIESATLTHVVVNNAVTSGAPSAILAHTVNNPSVTTGNPSASLTHSVTQPSNHTFTQPTFTGTPMAAHDHAYVPFGTNSAPTFTGDALATHDHNFTPSGSNSVPTFTGAALAAHDHSFTPAGTVSQPTFAGALDPLAHSVANNEPVFYSLAFVMKT